MQTTTGDINVLKTLTAIDRSEINDFRVLPKPPGTFACQKHFEADRKWVLTPVDLLLS